MMTFGKVHCHYTPEGRSKKVNAEEKSGEEPPTPQGAQLVRKILSASASWEAKLPDVLGLCPNMRSKGLLEVKE
ncbi:hypothetical protein [Thermococcus sp.]|uniref:hypothetical protein n=1 Tax=Thermococcus sp. TaxID=35749 RepID=UPI002622A940|nr:hypothetical protein [Thermococcus sp.]